MRDRALDDEVLGAFKESLWKQAPEVVRAFGPGAGRDEIQTKFEAIGVTPSEDAIAWWSFWDLLPVESGGTFHGYPFSGWQFIGLNSSVAGTKMMREVALSLVASEGLGLDDRFPSSQRAVFGSAWIALFASGGSAQAVLDCASPRAPSVVRECSWESFSGRAWGRILYSSMASWIAGVTEQLQRESLWYDPEFQNWAPPDDK